MGMTNLQQKQSPGTAGADKWIASATNFIA
jgi:hypothetical protein